MKELVHPLAGDACCLANWSLSHRRPDSKRQGGAVAIVFAGSLMLIIGFFGLALDLSRVYNRKIEMQGVADAVAVAAARSLNGSANGINAALAAAHNILDQGNYRPKYDYNLTMNWSNSAIQFSRSADGSTGWMDASDASASAAGLMFVKVDTNALNPDYGKVDMMFMPVLPGALGSINVGHVSVAGKSRLGVTPLAICAMSNTPTASRTNPPANIELVEYGFRRGVSYDLMNLNPNGTTRANFLIDPVSPPGSGGAASNFSVATVAPHVCAGTVALPKVSGASVSVQSGFPLAALFNHLNSRFDLSNGNCNPNAAPPDTNVKQYAAATIGWMTKPVVASPAASYQTAKTWTDTSTSPNSLRTIADLPPPNPQAPKEYGPLWAYARPLPFSSVGQAEPANGYIPFAATQAMWNSLYNSGPTVLIYPSSTYATPYNAGGSNAQAPTVNRPGIVNRRVLNIPLLECPVSGATAHVLAIGKFFMTIPADATTISAEFAGAAVDQQFGGPVELYR